MDFADKTACISPIKLNNDSEFEFECNSKLECFTICCRGTSIPITPYDAIQLQKRLDLSSRNFLALYTKPHLLEKTDLPIITLKMLDDKKQSCPFVKNETGCIIYDDRPTSCRYYPLGTASLQHKEDSAENDNFFFFVNEQHCKGFTKKKKWSVSKWRENQQIKIRDKINSEWTDLIVRKRSFPSNIKLSENAKQLFFLVSYDIDKFREFVFKTSFLKRFKVDNKTKMKINDDKIELLKFGLSWLKGVLFKNINPNENQDIFNEQAKSNTKL